MEHTRAMTHDIRTQRSVHMHLIEGVQERLFSVGVHISVIT